MRFNKKESEIFIPRNSSESDQANQNELHTFWEVQYLTMILSIGVLVVSDQSLKETKMKDVKDL